MVVRAHLERRHGEAAIVLGDGDLEATFLPACGMLGVSFRHRGEELLALPHSPNAWKEGATTGLALLHPWANRLGSRAYRSGARHVDLTNLPLPVDGAGRPIHGTVRCTPFAVRTVDTTGSVALARVLLRSTDDALLSRAFPFAHDLEITATLDASALQITTKLTPIGSVAVPVSFGWHPYFRMPGERRTRWRLRLPARVEVELGTDQLPTGERHELPPGNGPVGGRTFDNLYALRDDRLFTVEGGGRKLSVTIDAPYPYAQVYSPPRAQFVCIEPMTASVDALRTGAASVVEPGESYSATFTMAVR